MTKTFLSLLELADISDSSAAKSEPVITLPKPEVSEPIVEAETQGSANPIPRSIGLRYNIEIHLPPTKDVEVYNAIFKSIKEHLLDQ